MIHLKLIYSIAVNIKRNYYYYYHRKWRLDENMRIVIDVANDDAYNTNEIPRKKKQKTVGTTGFFAKCQHSLS